MKNIKLNIMKTIRFNSQILLLPFCFTMLTVFGQNQKIIIDTDFPGGNIIIDQCDNLSTKYYEITQDMIHLRPDLRDTKTKWFYWSFRVSGAGDRTLSFNFPDDFIGSFGPAYSLDGGESWQWLHDNIQNNHSSFEYKFQKENDSVLFSMQIPYMASNLNRFLTRHNKNPYLSIDTLTISEKGRVVEQLIVGNPKLKPKYKMVITARHHACESMASYALEGLIEAILAKDSKEIEWLRNNVEILIVPFVDKDGVQDGDQGKNRKPYDHNKDYARESIYNSVRALREKIPVWSEGKLKAALDMHCPGIIGKWHENIYFVGMEGEEIMKEQEHFTQILLESSKGELILNPKDLYLKFGVSWNNSERLKKEAFAGWASSIMEPKSLAITLEIPYSNNEGQQIVPSNAKLFGRDLANAIALYFQNI